MSWALNAASGLIYLQHRFNPTLNLLHQRSTAGNPQEVPSFPPLDKELIKEVDAILKKFGLRGFKILGITSTRLLKNGQTIEQIKSDLARGEALYLTGLGSEVIFNEAKSASGSSEKGSPEGYYLVFIASEKGVTVALVRCKEDLLNLRNNTDARLWIRPAKAPWEASSVDEFFELYQLVGSNMDFIDVVCRWLLKLQNNNAQLQRIKLELIRNPLIRKFFNAEIIPLYLFRQDPTFGARELVYNLDTIIRNYPWDKLPPNSQEALFQTIALVALSNVSSEKDLKNAEACIKRSKQFAESTAVSKILREIENLIQQLSKQGRRR